MGSRMKIFGAAAACSLLMAPQASADRLVEGIVGFGIGVAVGKALSDQNRNVRERERPIRRSEPRQVRQPTQQEIERAAARERQREADREIQRRLNALNFDAGPADGSLGPRSRNAISSFQASIGHAVTGTLTPQETSILYARTNPGAAPLEALAPTGLEPLGTLPPAGQASPDLPDLIDIGLVPPDASGAATQQGVAASYPSGGNEQLADLAVLGIQPLDDLRDARALLDEAGYDNCQQKGGLLTCSQSADGLSDTLKIGFVNEGGMDKIHTLARRLEFDAPVPREEVLGQLAGSYSVILDAPDMVIATSPDCVSFARSVRSGGFDALLSWSESGEPATGLISALSAKCDYHYSLDIPGDRAIGSLNITMFTGAPIMHSLTEGTLGSHNARTGPQIRF